MNHIKSTIFLIFLLVPFSLSAETFLSKSSVSKLMQNVNNSARSMDVEKVSSYFTEDVSIILEMPKNMGGTQKLNKEQYKKNLREGFAIATKYTYDIKDIEIKISKDNKSATVTDLVYETVEINGRTISTKSHETINVIILDGVPKINSYYGKLLPEDVMVTTNM